MTYIYKVRRKTDGLFSESGMSPNFSISGKSWGTLGRLRNHLSYMGEKEVVRLYKDCEIVEYELSPIRSTECIGHNKDSEWKG